MAASSGASVLIAEAVGLLLEGLGLDDTLGGEESLGLVADLAALSATQENIENKETALTSLLSAARSYAELRSEVVKVSESRGLPTDAARVEAAMRILAADKVGKYIGALKGVPDDVAHLSLHEFEAEHRNVKKGLHGAGARRPSVGAWMR